MHKRFLRPLAVAMLVVQLGACATLPSPSQRRMLADELAAARQWQPQLLHAEGFALLGYAPVRRIADGLLTVYVEGDGLAWITPEQPSGDPTPRDPLALRLALAQPSGDAAWLARPCQYADAAATGCATRYWTAQRFAPEVIAATDSAISQLKQQFGAQRLVLVGYSGGGAVAALVTARRNDVAALITVAGNLDHATWTHHHRVPPLVGSMNAANEIGALAAIPQLHFTGAADTVVPPALAAGFASRFPDAKRPRVSVQPGFDHSCCWADSWAGLFPAAMRELMQ